MTRNERLYIIACAALIHFSLKTSISNCFRLRLMCRECPQMFHSLKSADTFFSRKMISICRQFDDKWCSCVLSYSILSFLSHIVWLSICRSRQTKVGKCAIVLGFSTQHSCILEWIFCVNVFVLWSTSVLKEKKKRFAADWMEYM